MEGKYVCTITIVKNFNKITCFFVFSFQVSLLFVKMGLNPKLKKKKSKKSGNFCRWDGVWVLVASELGRARSTISAIRNNSTYGVTFGETCRDVPGNPRKHRDHREDPHSENMVVLQIIPSPIELWRQWYRNKKLGKRRPRPRPFVCTFLHHPTSIAVLLLLTAAPAVTLYVFQDAVVTRNQPWHHKFSRLLISPFSLP